MYDIHEGGTIEMIQAYLCEAWTSIGYNDKRNSGRYYRWLKGKHGKVDPLGQQVAWAKSRKTESAGNPIYLDMVHREGDGFPLGMDYALEFFEEERKNQINEQDDMEQIEMVRRLCLRSRGAQLKFQTMTTFPKLLFLMELSLLTNSVFLDSVKEHAGRPDISPLEVSVRPDEGQQQENAGAGQDRTVETQQQSSAEDANERTSNEDGSTGEEHEAMTVAQMVGHDEVDVEGQQCCCCCAHEYDDLRDECIRIRSTNPNLLTPCLNHEEFLNSQLPEQVPTGCFFNSLRGVRQPDRSMERQVKLDQNEEGRVSINSIRFWRKVSNTLQEIDEIRTSDDVQRIVGHLKGGSTVDVVWWPTDDQRRWPQHVSQNKPWFFERGLIGDVLQLIGNDEEQAMDIESLSIMQIAEIFSRWCAFDVNADIGNAVNSERATDRAYFMPTPIARFDKDPDSWESFTRKIGDHLRRLGGWTKNQDEVIGYIGSDANTRLLQEIKTMLGVKRKHREGRSKKDLLTQIANEFRCGELAQETYTMTNWQNPIVGDDSQEDHQAFADLVDQEEEEIGEQQQVLDDQPS